MKKLKETVKRNLRNHQAFVNKNADVMCIDFKIPNSNLGAIRYVLLDNYLYVSGDLGCATFKFTHSIDIEYLKNESLNHFLDKLEAFSEVKYGFKLEQLLTDLKENKEEIFEALTTENPDVYDYLLEEAECCFCKQDWMELLEDTLCLYDGDMELLQDLGNVLNIKLLYYFYGLKMIEEKV